MTAWRLISATLAIAALAIATADAPGLIVEEVPSNSLGAKAGLKPDDKIIAYDNRPLTSPAALQAAEENTFGEKEAQLEVRPGSSSATETLRLAVPLGSLGIQARPELSPAVAAIYAQGRAALKSKEVDAAMTKWEVAVSLAQREGNIAVETWLYGRIGEAQEGQNRWKEASALYLAAWELLKQNQDAAAQSRTLTALGRCRKNLNDFPAASKWFEQARQIDLLAKNEMWVAADFSWLGVIARRTGDLQAAQDYQYRGLLLRDRLAPGSLDVAHSLNNLGIIANQRGDLKGAQDYLLRAVTIKQQVVPNSLDLASSLDNLGVLARMCGDLQAAQDYHTRALAIEQRLAPESLDIASSLNNLAQVAEDRGDLQAAQDYLDRAVRIKERLAPNSLDVASSLNNLGNVASDRGEAQAALGYFRRALSLWLQLAPDSVEVATVLDNLGSVTSRRGDLQTAQNYHNRALAIRERLAPDSLGVASSLNGLGSVARKLGEMQAAQDYLSRALAIREQLAPGSVDTARALTSLGEVALQQSRFEDANSRFTRAITIIESQRGQIPSPEARALLLAEQADPYTGLLRTQLALNDLPSAFSTSERARARSLLELLTEARADIRQGIEPSLLANEKQLQQSLNAKAERQTRLLAIKHTEKEAADAAKEIDALTLQYKELEANIRASSPHYAALTQPQPSNLEEVQRQVLDKDSLLLEYALGDEASYLFTVSNTSIKSYQLPKRAELEALAQKTYQALTARNQRKAGETASERDSRILEADEEYPKLASRLSQVILAPAAAEFAAKRLLIVGDGILLRIPFAALADPAAASPQPLLIAHEVVNLPSASVIALQRRELAGRKSAARQVAAFGDPIFERDDERVKALSSGLDASIAPAALPHPARDFEPLADVAGIATDRATISRLLFSRQEVRAIISLTPPGAGFEAVGFEASKQQAISSELSNYRIVHFATHALLNDDHPELSGIVLSLIDRNGQDIDGFLRLNEIYNLHLPADLVVLSACQTALGKQIKGEGLIGLVRGFMYAGAARIVASLWKVDDSATAGLMTKFYQKMLKNGEPVAAALHDAQLEISRQARWSNPYFWAGFELQGDWK